MFAQMPRLENAARLSMGQNESDPLPPGPTYGPYGYFRLALLVLAGVVLALLALNLFAG